MFEQQEPERVGIAFAIRLLVGMFAGFVGSILAIVLVFGGAMSLTFLSPRLRMGLAELFDFAMLGTVGYLAYQGMRQSSLARGVLIGISIAFLLNAICGVAMLVNGSRM